MRLIYCGKFPITDWIADRESEHIKFLKFPTFLKTASIPSLMASSSPPYLDSQGVTAFASIIGELCRPRFFMTIPLPIGAELLRQSHQ